MTEEIRADVQAEAIAFLEVLGRLSRGELLQRRGAEVATSVELAAVEQHAAERGDILGGGEQPARRHGETVRAIGEVGLQLAEAAELELLLGGVRLIGLGEARDLRGVGPEGGVGHAQRAEQALLHEVFVGEAADDLEHACGGVDAGVGILVLRARLRGQRSLGIGLHRRGERQAVERGLFFGRLERQAADVRKEIADRDRTRAGDRRILAGGDPLVLELRQVLLDGVVQRELAFVDEHHDGRGGDALRLRSDPEHGVRLHGLLGLAIRETDRGDVQHLVLVRDQGHRAGEFFALDERSQDRVGGETGEGQQQAQEENSGAHAPILPPCPSLANQSPVVRASFIKERRAPHGRPTTGVDG